MAGYAYGGDSQRFTGMKDEDVVDELVRDVAMFFNKTKEFIQDKLVDHAIKRWGLDPHQLGGFAFLPAHEVLLTAGRCKHSFTCFIFLYRNKMRPTSGFL